MAILNQGYFEDAKKILALFLKENEKIHGISEAQKTLENSKNYDGILGKLVKIIQRCSGGERNKGNEYNDLYSKLFREYAGYLDAKVTYNEQRKGEVISQDHFKFFLSYQKSVKGNQKTNILACYLAWLCCEHEVEAKAYYETIDLKFRPYKKTEEQLAEENKNKPSSSLDKYKDIDFQDNQWLNPYNEKILSFIGREDELEQLNDFAENEDNQFGVWAVVGPSGAGKTRLYIEWLKHSKSIEGWNHHILSSKDGDTKTENWENWLPQNHTVLVIDYMFGYAEVIQTLLQRFSHFKEEQKIGCKVRLLIIDHVFPDNLRQLASDPRWGFASKSGLLSAERFDLFTSFFYQDKPLRLDQNNEKQEYIITNLIAKVCSKNVEDEAVIEGVNYLRKMAFGSKDEGEDQAKDQNDKLVPSAWNPLFAALIGDAISREQKYSSWSRRDLMFYYLKGSDRLPWEKRNDEDSLWASCFVCVTTARRGVDYEALLSCLPETKELLPYHDNLKRICQSIVSSNNDEYLPPFEPDILGETFFLLFLKELKGKEKSPLYKGFRNMLADGDNETKQRDAIEFIGFIKRLVRNLSNEDQTDDEIKKLWQGLFKFLNPKLFSEDSLMPWAISAAIIEIIDLLEKTQAKETINKILAQVDINVFYQANNPKNQLLQDKEICLKSTESAAKYLDWKYENSEELPDKLPEELTNLFAYDREEFAKNKHPNLCLVCYWNLNNLCKILLDSGEVDVNEKTEDGWNPLLIACWQGNLEIVKYLISKKATIDHEDKNNWTSLMIASQNDHLEVVKYLIEKKATIDHENKDGWNPLLIACWQDNLEIVKYLIKKKATIDHENKDNATALMIASANGHLEVVKYLISKKATIDHEAKNNWTALMLACFYGHKEVVELLLQYKDKFNINHRNFHEKTALTYAIEGKADEELISLLRDHGAEE